ncbi:hypothetical protein FD754_007989 [Muntiacus muntjak]|uniref:CW-type domain-containing protein n=1 Tax=Muntiacus muntjak TaxID=9888 RepID=A0A5N3WQW2_MUNMU|nr:hypothetical protein FD754_007989 [Muntiacus muntjak]
MAMNSSVENNICINKVWVQCENESCLKWRLLSNEDKVKVNHNEPWYCFMNTDSKYNKCSVSEEDFPEESQLHQNGYRIVYSQLPLGSLVLPEKCKKNKWYNSALQEAYLLYGCSHEQRLERCYLSKQGTKAVLKSSFENVCSDDALSKENMVVSEAEFLLKELEQMLEQALEHTATQKKSEEELGEEANIGEKLPKCGPEVPAGSSLENHCEEDCLIIDGRRLKAGECIENITKKFKEIDALMSEF